MQTISRFSHRNSASSIALAVRRALMLSYQIKSDALLHLKVFQICWDYQICVILEWLVMIHNLPVLYNNNLKHCKSARPHQIHNSEYFGDNLLATRTLVNLRRLSEKVHNSPHRKRVGQNHQDSFDTNMGITSSKNDHRNTRIFLSFWDIISKKRLAWLDS